MKAALEHLPLVSVVVVNHNRRHFLHNLFTSLQACSYPHLEIILVDNGSTDDSVAYTRQHFPAVHIVELPSNQLFARANNVGVARSRGEIVGLLNNDVVVDPGFLEPIVSALKADDTLGAVQPKILDLQKPGWLEYAGAAGGFLDRLGYPFLRGRIFETLEQDLGQYDEPVEIFWGSGAALFFRRRAWEEAGGLDEDFQLHMEEIDLCWRIKLRGWKLICLPDSRIWHLGGGTLSHSHPGKVYWNFRNNLFLLIKNLSGSSLSRVLPLRFFLDALAFWRFALAGQIARAGNIVRAYGWLLSHLFLLWRKRQENLPLIRARGDQVEQQFYPGSVVLEYFLLGRKTFARLKALKGWQHQLEYRPEWMEESQKEGVNQPYGTETI